MNREAVYESAVTSFVPNDDDPPENIRYYRFYAGLAAAWPDVPEYLRHNASMVLGSNNGRSDYQNAAEWLSATCRAIKPPCEPIHSYNYSSPPDEPSEKSIREYFNDQFKRAFPGERTNSKHANALWIEKQEQARKNVWEMYKEDHNAFEVREARIEAENATRRAEWQEKVDGIRRIQALAEGIAEERLFQP